MKTSCVARHQLSSLNIDQIAVLDAFHSISHRVLSCARGIGVRRNIGIPGGRLIDGCAHFLGAELPALQWIIGRTDPAGREHLDEIRTFTQLVAHCLSYFIGTVRDARQCVQCVRAVAGIAIIHAVSHVSMAAGHADALPGYKQARSNAQPLLDGLPNPEITAGRIAHGRKTPIEHAFHPLQGICRHQRQRHTAGCRLVQVRRVYVNMHVYQAGHDRTTAHVNLVCTRQSRGAIGDLADPIALHDHARKPSRAWPVSVSKTRAFENTVKVMRTASERTAEVYSAIVEVNAIRDVDRSRPVTLGIGFTP